MNLSNFLAQLWGITFVMVSFALLIKPSLLEKLFVESKNKKTMTFFGVITLMVGLTMVLLHNLWVPNWRIIITILGWLTFLKGLDLLFFPKRMKKRWSKMKNWQWFLIFGLLLIFGLVLSYLGFAE